MESERDKLYKKLNDLENESKEIRKKIDLIDYQARVSQIKKYEGKCFKQPQDFPEDYIRCLFVFASDLETCETKSICINYYKNINEHFGIDYQDNFNPYKWPEDAQWEEITKEEFDSHYSEVMKRINFAFNKE